jgi:uncharacterized protein (TIGR03663 family)
MNRWVILALLLAAAAGSLLRWPSTGQRPMHNDEAVNGIKLRQLVQGEGYRYDPHEHHGPTLYYFTAALAGLTGARNASELSENRLRLVPVLFGIGLILLLPLFREGLGRGGIIWAAILTAVSPAFVFYSYYFIHEMLLVFFAAATIGAAWRYWQGRAGAAGWVWACMAGLAFGLMAATKETFVLSVAAGVGALVFNQVWNRLLDASKRPVRAPRLNFRHVGAGLGVAVFVAALFFTSFFSNWQGLVDAVRTYQPWLARAGGDSPHIHPWYFFWHRLLWFRPATGPVWTELLIFGLAIVGGAAGFHRKNLGDSNGTLIRFLVFYSGLLAAIYCIIPYKTPWCLLNFWHGFVLLAGTGAAWLVRRVGTASRNVAVTVILGAGVVHLGAQAWRAVGPWSADRRNPYVYAQTLPNTLILVERIRAVAEAGAGKETLIKVVAPNSDYWPLPWYLAEYNTGWWEELPADPYAPIMVVSAQFDARLDDARTHLMTGYYELRPGVFLELYVEVELWKEFLAGNKPAEKRSAGD